MDILIKALYNHGHNITVLRTTRSWYTKENATHYTSVTVPVSESFDEEFIKPILKRLFATERSATSVFNFVSLQFEMFATMTKVHEMVCRMVRTMFEDDDLMQSLREQQYDVILTDPAWGAGIMLAHYLNVPLVYNVRWITSGEGHHAIAPSPTSYIPKTGSGLTDKMMFNQRIKNLLFYVLMDIQHRFLIKPQYQAVCNKYFHPHVDFYELLQGADIWLMRVDFVFEFPRPIMPNFIYMGGFQCMPANPLPQHLEDFVQGSGEHGVIIMSLGTFVSELPQDITEDIAAAFAKMPQKIVWRHLGEKPTTLGNNTLLVDWMPQNDLLGHPKTRVFVAHGGTNGVQEAIYHGIPVVGIPLFFDQYDNLLRLKERGAAKMLSLSTVNENIFYQAVQEVFTEPSYRKNMQRLSDLHRDTPLKPLDSALFWIEFVMRHKGAAHLRNEAYKMPWYSYYSVDVVLFVLTMVLVPVFLTVTLVRWVCIRLHGRSKIKNE
ncbi:UDP-glucuronosyltransferase 2C1-like [Myxocyprinus asiaticus]|uniref:UDP-glucuronosyltransferase 2C1-like n=1 Tax=Myxocyprinus asiaticus TaxID=70543 RepID=UPI002221F390|nr:UDP-glucuronosyltransferase 2C1-like [Myxocyprinus asiaticus]